jgi:hypothetical protein
MEFNSHEKLRVGICSLFSLRLGYGYGFHTYVDFTPEDHHPITRRLFEQAELFLPLVGGPFVNFDALGMWPSPSAADRAAVKLFKDMENLYGSVFIRTALRARLEDSHDTDET